MKGNRKTDQRILPLECLEIMSYARLQMLTTEFH